MWTIFKLFIELVTIISVFVFWFFDLKACGMPYLQDQGWIL